MTIVFEPGIIPDYFLMKKMGLLNNQWSVILFKVVNAWYLSAYRPLRDPDGRTIGMLYVGLARAPYDAMRRGLIARFLLPVAAVGLLAVVAALVIVKRITAPLRWLSRLLRSFR